jgi:hypothetical protein
VHPDDAGGVSLFRLPPRSNGHDRAPVTGHPLGLGLGDGEAATGVGVGRTVTVIVTVTVDGVAVIPVGVSSGTR